MENNESLKTDRWKYYYTTIRAHISLYLIGSKGISYVSRCFTGQIVGLEVKSMKYLNTWMKVITLSDSLILLDCFSAQQPDISHLHHLFCSVPVEDYGSTEKNDRNHKMLKQMFDTRLSLSASAKTFAASAPNVLFSRITVLML